MNTPNPLIPQGAFRHSLGKSNLRIAVFTIAAIHLVFIGGLLMQGCKRDTAPPAAAEDNDFDRFASFPPYNPEAAPPVAADFPPPPPPPEATALEVEPTPPPVAPANDNNRRTVLPPPGPEATPEPGATEYVVLRGDSFWSIAQKHGVTVRAIERANPDVNPNRLQIGQRLQVPAPSADNGAQPAADAQPVVEDGVMLYTVRAGDNLTRIAQNHGTTLNRIRELNPDLRTDRILVGQQLRVPARE